VKSGLAEVTTLLLNFRNYEINGQIWSQNSRLDMVEWKNTRKDTKYLGFLFWKIAQIQMQDVYFNSCLYPQIGQSLKRRRATHWKKAMNGLG